MSQTQLMMDVRIISKSSSSHFNLLVSLNWKMAAILVLCWFIIFLGLVKGIKSSGKVMYFATLFPYMVLTAFFIRGLTLDGAVIGVEYMFNPDVSS